MVPTVPPAVVKRMVKASIRRVGYDLAPIEKPAQTVEPMPQATYTENPEAGPVNLSCKLERQRNGGPFEWPNIVALNRAVVSLIEHESQIIEVGGGTGCFAWHGSEDASRHVTCAELDDEALGWARTNRCRTNIDYVNRFVTADDGPYDLSVSIEVVEHVADYAAFLQTLARIAPRTLVTTPNRRRNAAADHAGPPVYQQHVREWSAGEFYWVLRCFWDEVTLYAMPDEYTPVVELVDVNSRMTPLIADCRSPKKGGAR